MMIFHDYLVRINNIPLDVYAIFKEFCLFGKSRFFGNTEDGCCNSTEMSLTEQLRSELINHVQHIEYIISTS